MPADRGVRGSAQLSEFADRGGLRWRVILDGPLEGATNMARDHALAATQAGREALVRFYRWSRPTLSLGRHEPAVGRWNRDRLRAEGIDVVRRPTGGRAVLHDGELTYAVVLPLAGRPGLRHLYRTINQALVRGLADLGVPARVVEDEGRVASLESGPCFAGPAPGEVSAAGRKLVGSAQARVEGRLLQHGSVLLRDDQTRLSSFRTVGDPGGAAGPDTPPSTLSEFIDPPPSPADLALALTDGFRAVLAGDWPEPGVWGTLTPEALAVQARLHARYASQEWTWRR